MLNFTKLILVRIKRLLRNKSGGVLLYTALSAPVLLGFGGLAVNVAFWNIEKRAVQAVATADINDTCVWVFDPDAKSAFKVSGGANASLSCGIAVNSVALDALTQSGTTSCRTATKIKVTGDFNGECVEPTPLIQVPPLGYPLAALQPPAVGGCDHNSNTVVIGGESITLSPGVYCGHIKAVSTGIITFEPGLYNLNGAGLDIGAQASATGDRVSFYLTENSGNNNNISLTAGATVSLVAATDGPLPGILVFHDRNSPTNVTHHLTGGSTMRVEGIIYIPNQDPNFSGGAYSPMYVEVDMQTSKAFTFSYPFLLRGVASRIVL